LRILVVEDYRPLRVSLVRGLRENGYAVDGVAEGEDGLLWAREVEYDVVVLDLMLPGLDGMAILRKLRREKHPARVLILTAKDTVPDRVAGLDAGADDYLTKPFAYAEFLARIQALVRRRHDLVSMKLEVGDLAIDLATRKAYRDGRLIDLTAREYDLLECLALRRGRVLSRSQIWNNIYDANAELNSNVVDVFVGTLRRKLEQDGEPRLIHTRRGMGYVLEVRR